MLDLVFLILGIYIIVKAEKGEYKETACNFALVVGILAGIFGIIDAFFNNNDTMAFLNVVVMLMAFGIRFAARLLVKLYLDKRAEESERYEHDKRLYSKFDDLNKEPIYTDENFDDEELRFGKGGYTDPKL